MGLTSTQNDPKWDARILADAAKINADPSRLAAAQSAAGEMLAENKIETAALTGIAKNIYDHETSIAEREKRTKAKQPA